MAPPPMRLATIDWPRSTGLERWGGAPCRRHPCGTVSLQFARLMGSRSRQSAGERRERTDGRTGNTTGTLCTYLPLSQKNLERGRPNPAGRLVRRGADGRCGRRRTAECGEAHANSMCTTLHGWLAGWLCAQVCRRPATNIHSQRRDPLFSLAADMNAAKAPHTDAPR